jgi:hypothetical protein
VDGQEVPEGDIVGGMDCGEALGLARDLQEWEQPAVPVVAGPIMRRALCLNSWMS